LNKQKKKKKKNIKRYRRVGCLRFEGARKREK
jgi:hypothetical protein